jgi:hypothetical protein
MATMRRLGGRTATTQPCALSMRGPSSSVLYNAPLPVTTAPKIKSLIKSHACELEFIPRGLSP